MKSIQWNGKNFDDVMNFMEEYCGYKVAYEDYEEYCLKTGTVDVKTNAGRITIYKSDYIVKNEDGSFEVYSPIDFKIKFG